MRASLRAAVTRLCPSYGSCDYMAWSNWDLQIIVTRDIEPIATERKGFHRGASRQSVPRGHLS